MDITLQKTLVVICILLAGAVSTAYAQTMYRCGKTFQDRPCHNGQAGEAVGQTTTPAAKAGPTVPPVAAAGETEVAPQCIQRGVAAQRIKWGRETGLTEEAQLASAPSAAEKQLISDVYQRQGSSSAIRAAVEADCVKSLARQAQAAALAGTAAKLLEEDSPAQAVRPAKAVPVVIGAETKTAASEAPHSSACTDLLRRVDEVRARQRVGGNASRMESLNRERETLNKRLSEAAC